MNKSKYITKFIICLFVILYSCDSPKNGTIKNIPDTSLIKVSEWLNLRIKPKRVLYKLKNKNYAYNKRIDIGLNKVPDSLKYLVCVLEYSNEDISTIKNELIKNNEITEIDLVYKNEIYQEWLPLEVKKRFKKSDIEGSILVVNPTFTLDSYFIKGSNKFKNLGFCFIEKNYLYIYMQDL